MSDTFPETAHPNATNGTKIKFHNRTHARAIEIVQ